MIAYVGRVFRSLKNPNYRIWAAGAVFSNIGTWVQRTAQDWLVLTQLTHHSASAVGFVMALQFGPQLLLSPWTGVAADRFNLRNILRLTQAAQGALALILGFLTVTGIVQLWQVYVFAFLFGCVTAFDAPARFAFVSELVDEADLPNAVALNSTSFNAARMIGPALAGLVIASVGTGWAFLVNGTSFVAVLMSLSFLSEARLRPSLRSRRGGGGFVEGLRYVWSRPDLRVILIMSFLIGTFGLNFPIYITTMAVRVFHADAGGYGLLSSMMAIGTIAGSLIGAGGMTPRFSAVPVSAAVFGLGCVLAAIAPGYWLFACALVVVGVATMVFNNLTSSLMQLSTQPSMRGRVIALRLATALGGTAMGAPIVGWIADSYGPRWALGVAAVSGFLAAAAALTAIKTRSSDLGAQPDTRAAGSEQEV